MRSVAKSSLRTGRLRLAALDPSSGTLRARPSPARGEGYGGRHRDGALKGLFAPARAGEPDAADPHVLMRTAILASGRAMTGRLWSEAKALAGLAESYGRLSDKRTGGGTMRTVDDVPLDLVVEISLNSWCYMDRMRLPETGDESHPDQIARRRYWAHQEKWEGLMKEVEASRTARLLSEARARAVRMSSSSNRSGSSFLKLKQVLPWRRRVSSGERSAASDGSV